MSFSVSVSLGTVGISITSVKLFACTNSSCTNGTEISGYENVLVSQLKIHFKKGDVVILISASGNSKNLLKASQWIKKNNGYIFSFLGFNGGKLKSYSNDYILVNTERRWHIRKSHI